MRMASGLPKIGELAAKTPTKPWENGKPATKTVPKPHQVTPNWAGPKRTTQSAPAHLDTSMRTADRLSKIGELARVTTVQTTKRTHEFTPHA